jgi:hypothetical protein
MPVYNKFKGVSLTTLNLASDDIRCLLLSPAAPAFNVDNDFVSDLTGECSGTGYARKILASKTVTEDDANFKSVFDAADPVWTGAFFSQQVTAMVIYKEAATDATRELICYVSSPDAPITTNGANFTFAFNAAGILSNTTSGQIYTRGLQLINQGTSFVSGDFRVSLHTSALAFNATHNFLSQVTASECSGSGYSRQVLANKSVSINYTTNVAGWFADGLVYAAANFGTPAKAVVYLNTGTDSTSELLAVIDLNPSTTPTNGFQFNIDWPATGIITVS